MTDDERSLLELLAKHAYASKPEGFTLVSGKRSTEYIDCKMALSQAEALPVLGRVFLSFIDGCPEPRPAAVGGLTMGADPIAVSTSSASAGRKPLRWFSVRKDAKEHGRKKTIEGDVAPGENVVVVDDVVTTGGSTVQAIQKCRAAGLRVTQVIVLVDREEEGGLESIRLEAGPEVTVRAVFTKSQVRAEWERQRQRLPASA
jgi:orotate phosphoribosyltransferase